MKKPKTLKTNTSAKDIVAATYPAVREFVRGYLHQDFAEEYGSAEGATKAFCDDASADEIRAAAKEWSALVSSLRGASVAEINDVLSQNFQAGWNATDANQLAAISKILQQRASK